MHPGCQIEQVYLCREPIDFRKAINGLSAMVEQELGLNPFGSAMYVFANRSRNRIKVLYWFACEKSVWKRRNSIGRNTARKTRKQSRSESSSGCLKALIYGEISLTKR